LLDRCEAANDWPGMYPTIQHGTITDAVVQDLLEENVA
jgi:hypothetical protein